MYMLQSPAKEANADASDDALLTVQSSANVYIGLASV